MLAAFDPTRRAVADLDEIAQAMHARLCQTPEIYAALVRQAELWRQLGPLPADAALQAMRRLPALQEWGPDRVETFTAPPQAPFYWDHLAPEDAARRTEEALHWFAQEMEVLREKARHEARVRKLRRQRPCAELAVPSEIRESIAGIVREVVAAELPAVLRALKGA